MDFKMQKWDDGKIFSICKNVIYPSTKSDNNVFSNSLSTLREVCGKRECGCVNYTPYQCLRLLLKLELSETVMDYSVGISLINNYSTVGHQAQCRAALERLTMHSLGDSSSTVRDSFLDQIWNWQGLRNFTINVIDELMQYYINRVEEEMFAIYDISLENIISSEVVWEDNQFEKYVFWSSKSTKIFTTVSSLLNSCLLSVVGATNHYEPCVKVVKQFVDKVKTECDGNKQDFVLLYPYEYHSLVFLMDIPPEAFSETPENVGLVGLETVVELVKQNLKTKPVQTFCLLTHFPKWVPYIAMI